MVGMISARVVAETAARLAAEVSGRHEMLQQRRGREPGLAELQVERALNSQRNVVADDVEQFERPHRERAAELHRRVDVVGARVVRLEHAYGVVEVREQRRDRKSGVWGERVERAGG